jgi:hypothetical protein
MPQVSQIPHHPHHHLNHLNQRFHLLQNTPGDDEIHTRTLFEEDMTPEIETLDENRIDGGGGLVDWRIHNERTFTDDIGIMVPPMIWESMTVTPGGGMIDMRTLEAAEIVMPWMPSVSKRLYH